MSVGATSSCLSVTNVPRVDECKPSRPKLLFGCFQYYQRGLCLRATSVAYVCEWYQHNSCLGVANVPDVWVPAQLMFGYQFASFHYYHCSLCLSATDVVHVYESATNVAHVWVPTQLMFGYMILILSTLLEVECYQCSSCLWVLPTWLMFECVPMSLMCACQFNSRLSSNTSDFGVISVACV